MHREAFRVGSTVAAPGAYGYGSIEAVELPTGGFEEIPVVVAHGRQAGPVGWVTANIHGGELTGIASIHQILTPDLPNRLRGTVVFVPSLNPAGLRVMQRAPYYEPGDPNRTWPLPGNESETDNPGVYERIAKKLFDTVVATRPAFLLDHHNASIGSIPFTILDRVVYQGDERRVEAEQMAERVNELARAYGLSIVNENPPESYFNRKLHRSVSGSMVNAGGIPALTLELGMGLALDQPAVDAGSHGILNVLRAFDMLEGEPTPISEVKVVRPAFPVRRDDSARAPRSGILEHLIQPGDEFQAGAVIGRMRDLHGRPLEGGEIVAKHDGWLVGWGNGIARYEGQSVASLAVRDEHEQIYLYHTSTE